MADLTQKLKENAQRIKLRPEDFGSTLENIGFKSVRHLGFTGDGGEWYFVLKYYTQLMKILRIPSTSGRLCQSWVAFLVIALRIA
jgi:hypothetical protein